MADMLFLLTDFGQSDCYAAQMKASVLSFCGGNVTLVDLTHHVSPGSIREGAFHLMTSVPRLPGGAVVLAVVDPGVGTSRRGLACRAGGVTVVGPDNGLMSWIGAEDTRCLPPPGPEASRTFHGRDWFAPMAARLLVNPGWMDFLEPCPDPVMISRGGSRLENGSATTSVAHVDHFGNCVLWMPAAQLDGFSPAFVRFRDRRVPVKSALVYQSLPRDGSVIILPGSQGLAELAVDGGRADRLLGLHPGDGIVVEGE